jgi:hypothetical protein
MWHQPDAAPSTRHVPHLCTEKNRFLSFGWVMLIQAVCGFPQENADILVQARR